jgi:hypothetical protein
MSRDAVDLTLSPDGDFIISGSDFKLSEGDDFLTQSARNRIKSIKIDWFYDNIGADLEEILGEPNTRDVAETGKGKILNCLTEDDLFSQDEVYIKAAPTGRNSVLYIVVLKSKSGTPIVLNVTLDLAKGITLI